MAAVHAVKRLQAQRFQGTYSDLSGHTRTRPAVRFFLDELYGEHDFSHRDEQFGRIAGAIEHLFPAAVGQLAVDLAEMHALTETLDHALASHWQDLPADTSNAERYVVSWRRCGARGERERQLAVVQHMGAELQRLTRMRSLRLGLRMMRKPANAAGLDALQHFLESGFDAFTALGDASSFLATIAQREAQWIDTLFDAPLTDACHRLADELSRSNP
ncbi:MAG: hypothetical protein GTN84_10310 [Hydrogenophaga sp.]|nr:hypothetical protein [Hydrogenophaga sp.]NIN26794.1 hypothetical protein [Hydrogenophaga sp.]NIN31495.1 hypothetical protein [Hydrogenophaga sp.]NIN55728.1 hypothetical protein [Hydrogenophaga sp.]NIO51896.1 hypothetical protein [Hydrogenophaga sp.]